MKYTEPGTYKIQYTAEDGCGKKTVADRTVIVKAPPRTVLYSDGTFIINELGEDRVKNAQLHGEVSNEYIPFDPNGATDVDRYIFDRVNVRPWHTDRSFVKAVEIGDTIAPTSMAHWFNEMNKCERFEMKNLDTSNVTDMSFSFAYISKCTVLDVSNFDTGNVTKMDGMFYLCSSLETIYASSAFVVSQVASSPDMFRSDEKLVGGAGTTYIANNPRDKTYARIDNPPTAPGYFTLKEE